MCSQFGTEVADEALAEGFQGVGRVAPGRAIWLSRFDK
jgi:hypothetical protein